MHSLPSTLTAALQTYDALAADPLWPGFEPRTIPLVVHSPALAYVVGHPAALAGYAAVGVVAGRIVQVGPPMPGMMANTASEVAGCLCALAGWDEQAESAAYARLLLHEAFHVFQVQGLGSVARPDWRTMALYPENDPVNNALARLENRLLGAALAGDPQAPAGFLAVRHLRQQRLAPAVAEYEVGQEYNEGTPTYVEVRGGLEIEALTERLLEANVGGRWASNRRFYYTGAAVALLLDRLLPGWQERFARGGLTLQGLLAEAVRSPWPAAKDVLADLEYSALLAEETAREQERLEQVRRMLEQVQAGPGILVTARIPDQSGMGWDPRNLLVVEPGVRLHTRWSALLLPDDGGKLEVTGLALEDRNRGTLTFRVAEAPRVTAADPWTVAAPGLLVVAPAGQGSLERTTDGGWLISLGCGANQT